jgi:thymidylate synthase (FAD)
VKEKSVEYIDPEILPEISFEDQKRWADIQDAAELLYLDLVNTKQMKKEDARFILPQSCTTSITITGNFQALLDFIKLRSDMHAQKEIREVALEVKRQLSEIAPNVF